MNKSRWQNYGLWVSVAALIPLVLSSFGVHIIPNYQEIINGVLSILVMAGIISNPTTTSQWYLDDKTPANTQDDGDPPTTQEPKK
ncbi:MAG: hypothetical protein ACRCW2_04470 [Cellulosilyticaceae bacterium]